MTRLVPDALRAQVISRIRDDADAADWDHLAQPDKSAQIARWVASPEVGGVLAPLLGSDAEVRLWIKDTALKRRARAKAPDAASIVAAALGPNARVMSGSVGIKPAHCSAQLDGQVWFLCWDRVANAKHLMWAAMMAVEAETRLTGSLVVFVEGVTDRTPDGERARIERIAARCGVSARWTDL